MPLAALILLTAAAQVGPNSITVKAHSWAPFISPMGEPFRARTTADDTLADWFYQADRNHDGVLTMEEMTADADRFFAKLDTDHNGEIDPDELVHYEWEIAPDIQVNSRKRRAPGEPVPKTQPRESDDFDIAQGPERGARRRPKDDGLEGAARYGLLNIPEPVAAADINFDRGISLAEFRQAAVARFQLLDSSHQGRIGLAQLETLRTALLAAHPPKKEEDAVDTRVGTSLPPGN